MQSIDNKKIASKNEKGIIEPENESFGIIVEGNATREELIKTFSMSNNEYLTCKWNNFLEHVPKETLKIKPYEEFKKKKDPVRKMILNGSFCLRSGEVIPAPYF